MCVFPSRGSHLSRKGSGGGLNTSPVNTVMFYLCGSRPTETLLFASQTAVDSLPLTGVGVGGDHMVERSLVGSGAVDH